jgi:(2Fe-2S) ferredoxin
MNKLRQIKAMITGKDGDADSTYQELAAAGVPVTKVDCRSCADPCVEGHEDFKFDVDRETRLLGSMKGGYRRQILISTGKSDWGKEVTEVSGTLAAHVAEVKSQAPAPDESATPAGKKDNPPGVHSYAESTNVSILNASHKTISEVENGNGRLETVLVFPDYRILLDVPPTLDGAKTLWKETLDPALGDGHFLESTKRTFESWLLPYSCVICLCSHKKRDNRCAIAAPKLEAGLISSLEHKGWEVHTQLDDTHALGESLSHTLPKGSLEEVKTAFDAKLRELPLLKRALVLRTSHIGGHKFAGNVVIYTPQGASITYGRVTPHEIESIVENTIIKGQILPSLLRGGIGISKPNCKSLADW